MPRSRTASRSDHETAPKGRAAHFDLATFRALAPLIVAAVEQGRFDPSWMNSVLRLVLVLDHLNKMTLPTLLHNYVFGRASLPNLPIRKAETGLAVLFELVQSSREPISMPWLLGVDGADKAFSTPQKRMLWAMRVSSGKTDEASVEEFEAQLTDTMGSTVSLRMPEAMTDAANRKIVLRYLGQAADPAWLLGGEPTPPAFLAALQPAVAIHELPPTRPITMTTHQALDMLSGTRCNPRLAAERLIGLIEDHAAAGASYVSPSPAPGVPGKFGTAVSDTLYECIDYAALTSGCTPAWRPLRAGDVRADMLIRSRDGTRHFGLSATGSGDGPAPD